MLATSIKGWEEARLARHEAGGQPVAQVLLADKALFAALTEAISRALISLQRRDTIWDHTSGGESGERGVTNVRCVSDPARWHRLFRPAFT